MSSSASMLATGHVGINVSNLERSLGFYQAVLGLEVLEQSSDGEKKFAFLGSGGQLLVTLWEQSSHPFQADRAGLHHLAFLAGSIDEVRDAEARVRAAGAKLYHDGIVPHREGRASGGIFFEDPDGTRLEIYAKSGADVAPAPSEDAPTCGFF